MGWSVIKIDEQGKGEKKLSDEFDITDFANLDLREFKLIKYLDPYGDSTFGSSQFDDLVSDLKQLEKNGRVKPEQIKELLGLISQCKSEVHTYLKFYGD